MIGPFLGAEAGLCGLIFGTGQIPQQQQLLQIDWLGDMRIHPAVEASLDVLSKGICGHRDNGDPLRILPRRRPDAAGRFVSVHDRHPKIH